MRQARATTWTRAISRLGLVVALAATGATTAAAQQETRTNQRIPLSGTVTIPGEEGKFGLSGSLHVTFFVHKDNAGGIHVRAHANGQGVRVTTPQNVTCRGVGAANLTVNVGATKGAATEGTAVANLGLICPGRAPNLRLHANLHLTINANNEVTATVVNVRLTRQG